MGDPDFGQDEFFPSSLDIFILKGLGLNFLFHNGIWV